MAMNPKEQAKAQADLNKLVKEGTISQREAKQLMDQMVSSGQATAQAFGKVLDSISKIAPTLKKSVDELKTMEDLEDALIDRVSILQSGLQGNLREFKNIGDETAAIVDNLIAKYDAELKSEKITARAHKELTQAANMSKEMAISMQTIADSDLAPVFEEAMSDAEAMARSIEGVFDNIPGGNYLFKALGGDMLAQQLQTATANGFAAMTQSMSAGNSMISSMTAGMKAFNATALMNPYVLIAAAIIAVIALIAQQNKLIREQAKAQGVSLAAAKQQVMEAKKQVAAGKTILANTEDILAVQNEVNNALGSSIVMNAENAAQVADVGKAMGYGAEMAAKSSAAMIQMGVAAADVAEVQMETNLMAVKAGVDMGKVQADIAENAGKTAKFFGGNVKALQKAAIEGAKLGVSLETMASVSDKLLDFENSISKQFEFQALTGRSLNLDLARNLALQGDIAGATKEIMNQVGTIHDFNSLDVIERQALADAAGMEVEELQKSLQLQAIRGDMTDEELARAQGLNLSAAELKDLTADDLKQKLASQDATAKMAATMNQLKEVAMEVLQPIMDIVSALMNVLSPIMKLKSAITKFLLSPLQLIFGLIDGLVAAIQPIFDIFDELGSVLGGTGGLGEMFKQIGSVVANVIFAPIKAIATFIKGVLSPVIAVIKDIFNSVGEVIGTITDALGGGGGGGLMGIFETIGNVIGTLISIPLKIIGFIVKNVIIPAVEFLLIPFQFIADIIAAIGDAIDTYLIQPIEKALEYLSYLNPANWFGGGDDASVEVTADGDALESAGSVDDGIIQNGKIISTNPQDTLIATKDPGGLFGSGSPGDVAKGLFSMTPMGMAANAMGGLFGGGDDSSAGSADNQAMLAKLDEVIAAIQGMEIKMDGQKVGVMTRVADTFRRG